MANRYVLIKRIGVLFGSCGFVRVHEPRLCPAKTTRADELYESGHNRIIPAIMARVTAAAPQKKQDLVTFLRTL